MGTTAEDIHRGLTFKGGVGPLGLSQNRCLVILEEQNEDCDDDVISEEEDKRLMEGRNRGMNDDHSGVNSSRSSTSTECWMNTYRKLRRASELIGASAVAIDNKIEMAMDLVKNHLMFAVREEMEQMRDQIRGLTERNKQLEEENIILRSSTTPENLARIFSNQMHSSGDPETANHSLEMTKHWLSTQVPDRRANHHQHTVQQNLTLNLTEPDRPRTPTTLIPIAPQFVGQVLTPTVGVAGIQLSASPSNSFPTLVQPFQFSKQTQFMSSFDPQVSLDSTTRANAPQFLLIKSDISPDHYGNNVAWTPSNEYNIILTGSNQNLHQQQQQLQLQQQQQLHHQRQQQQQQQQLQQQHQQQMQSELPHQK